MKKRNLQLFPFLFLALSACQKNTPMTPIHWKKGQSSEVLDSLKLLELQSDKKIASGNESIQFQEQKISSAIVEHAFVKTVFNKNKEALQVRGQIDPEADLLKSLPLARLEKKRSQVRADLQQRIPAFKSFEIQKIDLIISRKMNEPELLWRIQYFDQASTPWEMTLTENFQLRNLRRVGSQFHDTLALVFPKGPKISPLQEVILKGIKNVPSLSNEAVSVQSQAAPLQNEDLQGLKFAPEDSRFDLVQVFYFLNESLAWFEHKFNLKLTAPLSAEVHVGAPEKTNTAFYYQGKIRIGAGDDKSYQKIPQDPSIVIHESIHAIVESVARLPYEGEGGSLNEAYADFFTALQLDNPRMGEVAWMKGPFRRTIDSQKTLSEKTGGLYGDSAIVSGGLWELRKKFGPEKAGQIALLTLNRLNPMSDFADFGVQVREVLPMVLSGAELAQAHEIFAKRGF